MMNRRPMIGLLFGLLAGSEAFAFDGDVDRGARIYQQRCAVCHGPDGRGNDGMAVDFRGEWYRLSKSDLELGRNIRNGLQSPGKSYKAGPMPPQVLSDRDLRDVLAFIRQRLTQ